MVAENDDEIFWNALDDNFIFQVEEKKRIRGEKKKPPLDHALSETTDKF